MFKYIKKNNVSKNVILALDGIVLIASLCIVQILLFGLPKDGLVFIKETQRLWFFLLSISVFWHIVLPVHKAIIRQTSIQDCVKVYVLRVLVAISVFFGIMWLKQNFPGNLPLERISIQFIAVDFLCSSFAMIMYRVLAKSILSFHSHKSITNNPTLIYGAGKAGSDLFNQFKGNRNVLAFIDNNPSKQGKYVQGIRIYSLALAKAKFIDTGIAKSMVLAVNTISTENKKHIAKICLEKNMLLQRIPDISQTLIQGVDKGSLQNMNIADLLGREEIVLNDNELKRFLFGKNILVTGAAGSIGSEISRQILQYWPAKIIFLDHAESPLFYLEQELGEMRNYRSINTRYVVADICQNVVMNDLFKSEKFDLVFHAAAYKHVPLMEGNPKQALLVNTMATATLVDLAIQYEIEKFIQISTDKAVNPTNVMGASKRAAERYVQAANAQSKTQFITTRFGNVLGSNGSVLLTFKNQIEAGGPVTVTHKDIIRYFMTIPEACSLVLQAGSMSVGGEIYVFDMGEPVLIRSLAENMIRLAGLVPHKDINIVYTGLRQGEKLYEELISNEETDLSSPHPKIKVAQIRETNVMEVQQSFAQLKEILSKSQTNKSLFDWLQSTVPEYGIDNSFNDRYKNNGNGNGNGQSHISSYGLSRRKRVFDILFSLLAIPFACLILIISSLILLLAAGWPLFIVQQRRGYDGRAFSLYKLRSLKNGHNNQRAGMVKNDGTVIPYIGSFFRRTRIDELPQIFNILMGNMSWVGPRPEQLLLSEEYELRNEHYVERYALKPGISGWAQINNPDATLDDYEEKLNFDLEYIQQASFWWDCRILWKSLHIVLKRH